MPRTLAIDDPDGHSGLELIRRPLQHSTQISRRIYARKNQIALALRNILRFRKYAFQRGIVDRPDHANRPLRCASNFIRQCRWRLQECFNPLRCHSVAKFQGNDFAFKRKSHPTPIRSDQLHFREGNFAPHLTAQDKLGWLEQRFNLALRAVPNACALCFPSHAGSYARVDSARATRTTVAMPNSRIASSTCSLRLCSMLKCAVVGLVLSAVSIAPPAAARPRSMAGIISYCEKAVQASISTRSTIGARTDRGLKIFQAGARANSAKSTSPQTIPMPCRIRNNSPTIVPAVCVAPGKDPNVTAATTGKKISAPIQTMSARKRSVRRSVFISEEY